MACNIMVSAEENQLRQKQKYKFMYYSHSSLA